MPFQINCRRVQGYGCSVYRDGPAWRLDDHALESLQGMRTSVIGNTLRDIKRVVSFHRLLNIASVFFHMIGVGRLDAMIANAMDKVLAYFFLPVAAHFIADILTNCLRMIMLDTFHTIVPDDQGIILQDCRTAIAPHPMGFIIFNFSILIALGMNP